MSAARAMSAHAKEFRTHPMASTKKTAIVNVMEAAARKAARGLVRDFGEVEQLQVSKKGPADFVTAADIRAEQVLRRELGRARPRFGFLLEEAGEAPGEDEHNRWVVDPLDGTSNFMHGLPHFAISIAHERDGEVLAGVVYEPVHDELFWAEKGIGAYLNDRRIRVSGRSALDQCLFATGLPYKGHDPEPKYFATLEAVLAEAAGVRRFGSAALDLAYVAAGRYDGFWEFGLSRWDIAAGILLVREAGGMISGIRAKVDPLASGDILAANAEVHVPLERLLRGALRS
jgi:myo-inositol-1(or 4)-monophosphatase